MVVSPFFPWIFYLIKSCIFILLIKIWSNYRVFYNLIEAKWCSIVAIIQYNLYKSKKQSIQLICFPLMASRRQLAEEESVLILWKIFGECVCCIFLNFNYSLKKHRRTSFFEICKWHQNHILILFLSVDFIWVTLKVFFLDFTLWCYIWILYIAYLYLWKGQRDLLLGGIEMQHFI